MYNYHSNKKKQEYQSIQQEQKDKQNKQTERKKSTYPLQIEKLEKLVKGFVDRTMKSVHLGVGGYSSQKKYRDPSYCPRQINPAKNVGPPSFYFRDRSTLDRVKDAMRKNENLDQVPFHARKSPSQHQFRDIGGEMGIKFTAGNTPQRILQTIKLMKTNEIPSSWDIDVKLLDSRVSHKSKKSQKYEEQQKSRILPLLNLKHHPKSYESIKNKILVGPLRHANDISRDQQSMQICKTMRKQTKNKKQPEIGKQIKRVKFDTVHLDRGENSLGHKYEG